jgi:hypothetical protein
MLVHSGYASNKRMIPWHKRGRAVPFSTILADSQQVSVRTPQRRVTSYDFGANAQVPKTEAERLHRHSALK